MSGPAPLRWALGLALLLTAAAQAAEPPVAPAPASANLVRGLPDFSELVERVGPAVVHIRATSRARPTRREEAQDESAGRERGVGSGFLISEDGVLLSNSHVVEGADEIWVRLSDQREFRARLLGADKRSDVAVLKIEAQGLPTLALGDVSRLKVGEWVIAIGSPFNLENSVTAGIVSAKARDTGELLPLIQTDVAINPGNSGGPLINRRGEVVGINSQIYSRSGGYMGISFAIPADEVQRVAEQLRSRGRVVRGRIGLRIAELDKDVAESLGLPDAKGALVRGLEPGGPAERAGLAPGDIVTRYNGQPLQRFSELPRLVSNSAPGSEQRLQVWRRGRPQELLVQVAEQEPEEAKLAQASKPEAAPVPSAHIATAALGLQLAELSAEERQAFKLDHGLRVAASRGRAARAGLREGDVLLALGASDLGSAQQLELLLLHSERSKVLSLLFLRDGAAQYALIKPLS